MNCLFLLFSKCVYVYYENAYIISNYFPGSKNMDRFDYRMMWNSERSKPITYLHFAHNSLPIFDGHSGAIGESGLKWPSLTLTFFFFSLLQQMLFLSILGN